MKPASTHLPPHAVQPDGLNRRQLLTFAVSAPVVTVAAGFGLNLAAPGLAHAGLALTPPDTVDYYDLGDAVLQTALPTMPLVRLSVGVDNRVAGLAEILIARDSCHEGCIYTGPSQTANVRPTP